MQWISEGVTNLARGLGLISDPTEGMSAREKEIYEYDEHVRRNNRDFPETPQLYYNELPPGWDGVENLFDYAVRMARQGWGSNATGLDYVPYNGFRSTLHRGEMILSASDADALRSTGGLDYGRMAAEIASAMAPTLAQALAGTAVQMDGHTVGQLVGRSMARDARSKRYTT